MPIADQEPYSTFPTIFGRREYDPLLVRAKHRHGLKKHGGPFPRLLPQPSLQT